MRTYVKLILGAATAAVVLGAAVSSASARRIEVSSQRFHQVWTSISFAGEFATTTCPVTLEGSFHSKTTSKVAGQLVGYISRVTVGNASCTAGHSTALTETLPWHITRGIYRHTTENNRNSHITHRCCVQIRNPWRQLPSQDDHDRTS